MKELTAEDLAQYARLENEKLDNLLQQVRRQNKNIYVQAVPQIEKTYRWYNPFKPIIQEYDDYKVYRVNPDGSVMKIYHDYRSLKSYLIGFLEGFNIGKTKAIQLPKKKKKPEMPAVYKAPHVRSEDRLPKG